MRLARVTITLRYSTSFAEGKRTGYFKVIITLPGSSERAIARIVNFHYTTLEVW